MTITGYLRSDFPRCTVVDEYFGIRTNASEVVSGR